jgi:predicted Zn-dependent protease
MITSILPNTEIRCILEHQFQALAQDLRDQLQPSEQFTLTLSRETSQFTRFNRAKVRQSGQVSDGQLRLTLMVDQRQSYRELPFVGDGEVDRALAFQALAALRVEVPQLPIDPYLVLPDCPSSGPRTSYEFNPGELLEPDQVADAVLPIVADLDFAGLYAAGQVMRGYADSAGQNHWFVTDSYSLDYSVFDGNGQAIKQGLAGSSWDGAQYGDQIRTVRQQLVQLSQPIRQIPRGQYRTYFAPAAVAEIVSMLSWGGVSEASCQQGGSCFGPMRRGEKTLSPKLTLQENFQHGLVPRFNEYGEVAPPTLPILRSGLLENTLISAKTAKEYHLVANGATGHETLRSPDILPGDLAAADILAAIGTGLYVANLHYLSWSDRPNGRITGMTRYACFWVEKGEIVGPIGNLRFDETLYNFWGEQLLALTDFQAFIPDVGTYSQRALGGVWVPGMLVEGFTYTL